MENIKTVSVADLKGALNLYELNRRNIKPEAAGEIKRNAELCADELERRIGPNSYSERMRKPASYYLGVL